jgi:membrane protein implicated in regulation of membrane protease activity
MLLGCAAGAFLAGRIADLFARRAALFAIFAAISAYCAWKFVRETKGCSLEQMEL